jgi:hypothetical protein
MSPNRPLKMPEILCHVDVMPGSFQATVAHELRPGFQIHDDRGDGGFAADGDIDLPTSSAPPQVMKLPSAAP